MTSKPFTAFVPSSMCFTFFAAQSRAREASKELLFPWARSCPRPVPWPRWRTWARIVSNCCCATSLATGAICAMRTRQRMIALSRKAHACSRHTCWRTARRFGSSRNGTGVPQLSSCPVSVEMSRQDSKELYNPGKCVIIPTTSLSREKNSAKKPSRHRRSRRRPVPPGSPGHGVRGWPDKSHVLDRTRRHRLKHPVRKKGGNGGTSPEWEIVIEVIEIDG